MTVEKAVRLGRYLGTGPEFGMALQSAHDIATVNREKSRAIRERSPRGRERVVMYGVVPSVREACAHQPVEAHAFLRRSQHQRPVSLRRNAD